MRPLALLLLVPAVATAQGTAADYARANGLRQRFADGVSRDRVEPHWLDGGDRFWYRVRLPGGREEVVLVDAVAGTRRVVAEADLPGGRESAPPPRPVRDRPASGRSPDGRWQAFLKENDVWLRDTATREEVRLSTDGTADDAYGWPVFWSPDSAKLVANRVKRGGDRTLTLVESSPRDRLQPRVRTVPYLKPGDPIPQPKPHLFDVAARKQIPVPDALFPNPWDVTYEHWSADSTRFFFVYNQRGHQVVRLIAVDAATGTPTAVVNEECRTFFDYAHKLHVHYLDATGEVVWMSERDGWNHLYLIDATAGTVKHPITRGEWVVRGVDRVDAEGRQVWFRAMGIAPGQDPYHVHHARINFDGTGLTVLTAGDGTHTVRPSPNGRFVLDTYSRVDRPPVTELRRSSDGGLVLKLEEADVSKLRSSGWRPPERFVAKGRDGVTDIHGLIVRPTNFDPAKRYRVIESIYAGPHDHHVPKAFRPVLSEQAMADLGFIVVKLDGMGTNWRSKAFHDVCWRNLGDSGFPDRVRWIRAAAAAHPEMDVSKGVGIYGGSAGGQSTVRGMTEYPDFYVVGVADCGCHDNRMDKVWWNELWMGWPVGPHYAAQSNVTNAHKLRGKLLLVVGELDTNVDPASTLQVADALIRADRDFDLLLVPGAGHGAAESPYGRRQRADFFVRHLLGVEPRR
jgi:dipeptidyl aminopeptidase/acylaminoacyl peptidase